MSNKRRPQQTKNIPTARGRTKRRTKAPKKLPKLVAASPQIERDFYVPNNPQYFSTTSNLRNYVGDNGDLFPHLKRVVLDCDNSGYCCGAPISSPRNLAAVEAEFVWNKTICGGAVQCTYEKNESVLEKQLVSPHVMSSFSNIDDSFSDKQILRQLLLGDTASYSADNCSARNPANETAPRSNDELRELNDAVNFGDIFRDSVGVVVDQVDFLRDIYGTDPDEKGVVCSRVDPAEHCVPAPDLTSPYLSKLPSPKKPVAETLTTAYDPPEGTKDFFVENLLTDSAVDEAVDYYCDLEEFGEILDTIWKDLPAPKSVSENDLEISCDFSALRTQQPSVSSLSAATLPPHKAIDPAPSISLEFGDNEVGSISDGSAGSLNLHNSGEDCETSSFAGAVSSSRTGVASICDHTDDGIVRSEQSTESLLKILTDENSTEILDDVFGNCLNGQEMIYRTMSPTPAPDDDSKRSLVPNSSSNELPCSSPATLAAIASITASPIEPISARKRTSSNTLRGSPAAKIRRTVSNESCGENDASTRSNDLSPTTQQRFDDCALGNTVENGNLFVPRYDATLVVPALASDLGASVADNFNTSNNCQSKSVESPMDLSPFSPLKSPASTSDIDASGKDTPDATHRMYWKKKIKYSRSLSMITEEREITPPFLEPTTTTATTVVENDEQMTDSKQEDHETDSVIDEPIELEVLATKSSAPLESLKKVKILDSRPTAKKIKKKIVRSKKIRKSTSRVEARRRTRSQSKQQPPTATEKSCTSSPVSEPNESNATNTLPKVSLNLLIQKNIVDFTPVLDLNLIHENLYHRHVKFLQMNNLTVAKCKVMRKILHRDRFRLQQIINLMEKLSKLLYYYYVWECRELKRERKSDDSTVYSREWEESKRKEIVQNMETTLPMTGNQRFDSKIFEHFHSFLQTLSDEPSRSTQTFHAKERQLYDSFKLPHVYSGRSILLPVKQYVRSYVQNALSYDTCKYLLGNDGNVSEKTSSKSIGVSANANAQTAASLSVCLVEKQLPNVEELSEPSGAACGSLPRSRCVQSWKREYEKFYYTLNFLFIINYKFVLYSHHCNFLVSTLSKRTEEQNDTTGFNLLPRSFWGKSGDVNFPFVFTPILKGHTLSDKLDMCVPSPGNPQTPASVRPAENLNADNEEENETYDDVLVHSESAESGSDAEVNAYSKPTIINVVTLQKGDSSIVDCKNDSPSPPLSLKIVCEQPADNRNESSLDILEINRQRSEALKRQLCLEKSVPVKEETDIEQILQRQLNMVKIMNRESMDFLEKKETEMKDSRRTNNQYSLLERVSLRAFFSDMSVAEKQQTLSSIKDEQYLFFHLERMYLEYYYKKEKRQKLSVECAFLEDSKSRSKKIVENV